MDRDSLKTMLDEGLSLAEVGRRVGRHESTVGYWVGKHGLTAVGSAKFSSRGGISRETLAPLVARGLSARAIGEQVGLSKTTVRHWLKEYGLVTQWAARQRTFVEGVQRIELRCASHGLTTFIRRADGGYRCGRCRSEAVSRRRRRVKAALVEEAGGRCSVCGYDRCAGALEFHHLVPAEKRFSLSHRGVARSLEKARAEAGKCALLCGNCHAEVEAGIVVLAEDLSAE